MRQRAAERLSSEEVAQKLRNPRKERELRSWKEKRDNARKFVIRRGVKFDVGRAVKPREYVEFLFWDQFGKEGMTNLFFTWLKEYVDHFTSQREEPCTGEGSSLIPYSLAWCKEKIALFKSYTPVRFVARDAAPPPPV